MMADIELVIKISKEDYERLKEYKKAPFCSLTSRTYEAIANGIPLPKGHGRLKDADKIANKVNDLKNNWDRNGNEYESGRYESYDYAVGTINDEPTIIEADTESENKE